MAKDRLRSDLHSHTYYSPDSITSPQRLVQECLRKGINCLAVTDHNTIRGALAVQELAPFKVIVGEEIRTAEGEVLGLFLTEEVPRGLPPAEAVARVKTQGGLVGIPHPYDSLRYALRHQAILALLPEIDFIEAFNARIVFKQGNLKARRFAQEHGLAMSAASDAHSPWEIGRAYVEMGEFEGSQSFLERLREGRIVGSLSSPLVHFWSRWSWLRRKLGWRPV